MQEIPQAATTV